MDLSHRFKVLVVDDEKASRLALEVPLRLSGYDVTTAGGGKEAVELGRERHFDVVLTDIYMPDLNGLEVVRAFKTIAPETRVVVLTAQGSLELALQAIEEGAFDFIAKPYLVEELLALVERAVRRAHLSPAQVGTTGSASGSSLIGHSPLMVEVYKMTAHAARTNATVLIEGESGTGKELVARAIHSLGQRATHPFTAVNCSAMTETLLESELFGHTRGAFTGADTNRAGLFESTNGGTIFLDELGSTSPGFQSSLLRVLQQKEVRRLGSRETRAIDVRIIGATNRSLESLVAEQQFRADLFYRLSVLVIRLPPLRERGRSDVALLTEHFLSRATKERGARIQITEQALELLLRYHWPGNVRELENAILHAVAVCSDNLITGEDLPSRIVELVEPPPVPSFRSLSLIEDRPPLAELERRYAQLVLAETGGNKSRAAEILGIDRRTVYRLLEIHDATGVQRSVESSE